MFPDARQAAVPTAVCAEHATGIIRRLAPKITPEKVHDVALLTNDAIYVLYAIVAKVAPCKQRAQGGLQRRNKH